MYYCLANKLSSRTPCWIFIRDDNDFDDGSCGGDDDDDGSDFDDFIIFFQLSPPRFMFSYLFSLVFLLYNVSFSWTCSGYWLSIYMRFWIGRETACIMLCGERGMHFRICRDLLIADSSIFFAIWHFSLFFLSQLFLFKRSFGGEGGMWVDLFCCLELKG